MPKQALYEYSVQHVPATALSVEVEGLVDGSTVRDWEDAVTHTVTLVEAPVDRKREREQLKLI